MTKHIGGELPAYTQDGDEVCPDCGAEISRSNPYDVDTDYFTLDCENVFCDECDWGTNGSDNPADINTVIHIDDQWAKLFKVIKKFGITGFIDRACGNGALEDAFADVEENKTEIHVTLFKNGERAGCLLLNDDDPEFAFDAFEEGGYIPKNGEVQTDDVYTVQYGNTDNFACCPK